MSTNGKAILETGSEDQNLNDISLSASGTVFSLHSHSQSESPNLWENWTPNMRIFDARVIHLPVTGSKDTSGSTLKQHGIQSQRRDKSEERRERNRISAKKSRDRQNQERLDEIHKYQELMNEQKELKAAIRKKEKDVADLETIVNAISRDNKDKNGNPVSSKTSLHSFGCNLRNDKEAEEINCIKSKLMNNPYEKALNVSYRQSRKFSTQESVDSGSFFVTGDDYFSNGKISVTKFGGQNENPLETVMQPVDYGCEVEKSLMKGTHNKGSNFPSETHMAYTEPPAKFAIEEAVDSGLSTGGENGWSTESSNFCDDYSNHTSTERIKCTSGQSDNLDLLLQDLGISDLLINSKSAAPPPEKKRKINP